MSEPTKTLVPKLRFPEFLDVGEWKQSKLGERAVSIFVKERTPLQNLSLDNYVSTENLLPDFAGVINAAKLPTNGSLTRFKEGDVLISNIRPYLKKVWSANKNGASSNDVIVIRAQSSISDSFLTFLLKNDNFIDYIMKGAKGVKMPRGDISLMKEYPVAIPSPKEQQKIADCLSSIDELITAQTKKIAALKNHKKGLMQQLFPAEGETTPQRRFPEFQNAGEWEEKAIGQVARYENGKAHEQDISEFGQYVVVNSRFISTDGEVKKYTNQGNCLAKKDDILMVLSDVPNGRAIAKCFIVDVNNKYTVNQRICKLTPTKVLSKILFYLINRSQYFLDFDDGVKQTNLKNDDVLNCPILLPENPLEQQKIANCLSSLDDLITTQTQKMEALKAHKKGLMQQLFPSADEVVV